MQSRLRHAVNIALAVLSLVAAVKLIASGEGSQGLWLLVIGSGLLGIGVTLPIGGADMPVVISLLNSYSGVAAAAAGFVVGSQLLIVAGAMVGAAGLILTQVMCDGMNRSLVSVLFGGALGATSGGGGGGGEYTNITSQLRNVPSPLRLRSGDHCSGLRFGRGTGSTHPAGGDPCAGKCWH